MKTPKEVWLGHPPSYDRLRVFGCVAYAYIRQDKLEPRTIKCMFLGYPQGVKRYKLWCLEPGHRRYIISRDVVFNESEMAYKTKSIVEDKVVHASSKKDNIEVKLNEENQIDPSKICTEKNPIFNLRLMMMMGKKVGRVNCWLEIEPEGKLNPPEKYDYVDLMAFSLVAASEVMNDEPNCYKVVVDCKEKDKWLMVMDEEMKSLHDNHTWDLVKRPAGSKLVNCKWIFKRKQCILGVEQGRFKARLVARGFTQREGIDYNDVLFPVVKHRSIRILLSMVAKFDLELEQMDVKTIFLYGELEETIYMRQPEGFIIEGKEDFVCKLNKSQYGLK